jgi:hypothetical protein
MDELKHDEDRKRRTVTVESRPGETLTQTQSRFGIAPEMRAAELLVGLNQGQNLNADVTGYVAELERQASAIKSGDLSRLEEMMTAQAHSLNGLFYSLTNSARVNSHAGYLDAADKYYKLALKAQAQCRCTAEAIATIKNPPILYAKQANIAHGPQQVNNGFPPAHAEQTEIRPTKLLEADDAQRLDTRAPGTTGAANQEVETVGALDRTAHTQR